MASTHATALLRMVLVIAALAVATMAAVSNGAPDGRFGIASPHAGDRWSYNVTALDGPVKIPQRNVWLGSTFERGPFRLVPDAAGTWQWAQDITEHKTIKAWTTHPVHHQVAGPRALATTTETDVGGYSSTKIVTPNNQTLMDQEQEVQWTWDTTYATEAPCGHASSLQGALIETKDPITVAGDCGGAEFHATGKTTGGLLVLDNGKTRLWMSANVPVPVRIEQPLAWNTSRTLAMTLDGFSAGPASTPPDAPLPQPLPALVLAAGDRPQDDLALAFHLADALDLARASGPLADFEHSHPGSYLRAARSDERVDEEANAPTRQRSVRWDLESTDGHAAARVRVSRTWITPVPDDRVEALVRMVPLPPRDDPQVLLPTSAGPYAPAAPTVWPTVASALARWHALGGAGENAWGFEAACADAGCTQAEARTVVGHDDRFRPDQPVGISIVSIDRRTADLAAFSANATAWHERAAVQASKEYSFGPLKLGEAAPASDAPLASTAVPVLPLGLAATAGLVLLLALLPGRFLASLWHRPAADHPLRAQIVQLLEAEPGLHHKEIIRRLGRGNSVVSHHLRTLEREGRIAAKQGPRYRVYFLPTQQLAAHAAVARTPLAERILEELQAPATGKQLADRLGVAPSSIAFHVRRFEDAGLVVARRVGREVVLQRVASAPAIP